MKRELSKTDLLYVPDRGEWRIWLRKHHVRIRVAFIDGARNRPREFKKRLRYFIRMTEKNRQFGFGGIEKHF